MEFSSFSDKNSVRIKESELGLKGDMLRKLARDLEGTQLPPRSCRKRTPSPIQIGRFHGCFPTPLGPAKRPSILSCCVRTSVRAMRRDHFGRKFTEYRHVQRVAVVRLVSNQSLGNVRHKPLLHSFCHQGYFSRRSTRRVDGDRKTMAVGNCHDFTALSALGLPNAEPPFLAGTNVPSMKHSRRSKPPRSFRSWATANNTCSKTPVLTHCWNRRCTVLYAPYRSGKSFQGAPVRRIQRIPLNTLRRSLQGRPRWSSRTGSGGRMALTALHCSSVKSIHNHYTVWPKVQVPLWHTYL